MKSDAGDGGAAEHPAGDVAQGDTSPGDGSPGDAAPRDVLPGDGSPGDGSAGDGPPGDGPPADTVMDTGGNVDAGADLTGPPPSMLTATVVDRRSAVFELLWTAPANGAQPVSGYQVRHAKVPITATNFDDATVTTAIAYTKTPSNPGTTDGMRVSLYIENAYYFAVQGTDSGGSRVGALMTTASPVVAHFNVTVINSPTGTNQGFGSAMDGALDVNGDGLSDLLVGTLGDKHAYLFLGATAFGPTAPAVTFTGTSTNFGVKVAQIGDIDKDGFQDLAIADLTGQQVFIYKGRATWPATLADTEANYVITTDTTYASSNFGFSMAPVGDFDGDGTDDFAIGAPLYSARVGRAVVVYGRAGFTSFALPDASTTRALEIAADPALNRSQLGTAVGGLGHFYAGTGTTLVVSASGFGTAATASSNEGRIYAFHGRGPGAVLAATAADHVRVGPALGAEIGQLLMNLGPVTGALPSLGTGNTVDTSTVSGATGTGYVLSGTATTGPLANLLVLYKSGGSNVGQVLFGGGFSGRDIVVSMIGDAKPDVAVSGSTVGTIDIVDGAKVPSLVSPVDSTLSANVHVPLPAGWTGTPVGPQNLIKDINGDGHPDFALGDLFGSAPGRVAVFW